MSDLICSATNCVNNIDGLCSAVNIHVIGIEAVNSAETSCKTFAPKGFVNTISSIPNTNILGEIKQIFNGEDFIMSPRVICESKKCRHNSGGLCCARHIQINGSGNRNRGNADCETFII